MSQTIGRLMLGQNNKTEYMVYYRMLKFDVMLGVKVKKNT